MAAAASFSLAVTRSDSTTEGWGLRLIGKVGWDWLKKKGLRMCTHHVTTKRVAGRGDGTIENG